MHPPELAQLSDTIERMLAESERASEVVRRLRRAPDTKRALIIAVTGYGTESDRRRAVAAGFDHHLTKPIAADALEKLIAAAR